MKQKLLFVVNVDWFFLSHRLPIALEALRLGYEVHVAVGVTNGLEVLRSHGLIVHSLSMRRGNVSMWKEMMAFFQILQLFWKLRPDLVHLVTIKPVLFGGMAARLLGVPAVVAAISGLGFVFVDCGWKARIRRCFVGLLYRFALGSSNQKVVFQNSSDRDCLVHLVSLPSEQVEMIRGSGVDLQHYVATSLPPGVPLVLMASRLLVDKGVWEFVQTARVLKRKGIEVRFGLVGDIDSDNPKSLTKQDLEQIREEGVVELWGYRSDMQHVLAQASIVVLPSYYGEGLPKILIEAAACGRAVVTTDIPGCRDAMEEGNTGLLVPVRDSDSLARAIRSLLEDMPRCRAMGEAGRRLAERMFDVRSVMDRHMQIYRELMEAASCA